MIQSLKVLNGIENPSNNTKNRKNIEQKNLLQIREEVVEKLMDKIYGTDFESESERIKFQTKIEAKIQSGAKLSQKEMNYLRKNNPYMYQHMVRVQQKRESLKEQLKHCRTKEEAQQAMSVALSSIDDKDPVRDAMIAAVVNVSEQFRSSDNYQKLPNTKEDLKKLKHVEKATSDPFKQDEENSRDDGEYDVISYNFNSNGYQEAVMGGFTTDNVFVVKV